MIKVCSYKLLMAVFVYNYVILEYSIFYLFRSQANGNCLFFRKLFVLYLLNCYVWRYKSYVDNVRELTAI